MNSFRIVDIMEATLIVMLFNLNFTFLCQLINFVFLYFREIFTLMQILFFFFITLITERLAKIFFFTSPLHKFSIFSPLLPISFLLASSLPLFLSLPVSSPLEYCRRTAVFSSTEGDMLVTFSLKTAVCTPGRTGRDRESGRLRSQSLLSFPLSYLSFLRRLPVMV